MKYDVKLALDQNADANAQPTHNIINQVGD